MTVTEIANEMGRNVSTVVKRMQDGGVFFRKESLDISEQTVNPTYKDYIQRTGDGDWWWNGSEIAGRKISVIARS